MRAKFQTSIWFITNIQKSPQKHLIDIIILFTIKQFIFSYMTFQIKSYESTVKIRFLTINKKQL